MMPPSRQPQNAMIHSGRFSLQNTTLSPFRTPALLNRNANPRAARPISAYEWLRALKPSSYTRN